MKINKVLQLFNKGDKAKLYRYLQKGIFSKEDKIKAIKINVAQSGGSGGGAEIEEYYKIDESKVASGESMYYNMCLAYTSRIKNNRQIMPSGMLTLILNGTTGCKYTPLYDITSTNGLDSLRQIIIEMDKNVSGILSFFDKVFTPCTKEEFYNLDI